jgi:formylglycine-generating enzyme required for sulfatase activity
MRLVSVVTLLLVLSAMATAMEFVPVGDPNNEPDPLYGFGAVPYPFEMGKFEITNAEYADFLNAAASKEDPHGLYNPNMSTGLFGGIDRVGEGFPCSYRPKPGWERRPVVYVGWYDLARMANWLHYGRTEGTDTEGAYDTRAFPRDANDRVDPARLPPGHNPKALYWIPTEDEWYKAAYYDPTLYGKRHYWDFPVSTSDPPDNSAPPGTPHSANYAAKIFSIGKPYFLTEAGSYTAATSHYGTYDQGGNVWEWLETWRRKGTGWRDAEPSRGVRGGSATYNFIGLHASNTDPGNPSHETFVVGGRLARAAKDAEGKFVFPAQPKAKEKSLKATMSEKLTKKRLLALGIAGGFLVGLIVGWMAKRRVSPA